MRSLLKDLRYHAARRLTLFLEGEEAERDDAAWEKMHEEELQAAENDSESIDGQLVPRGEDDEPEWTEEQVKAFEKALDASDRALDEIGEKLSIFEQEKKYTEAELQAAVKDLKRKNSEYFDVIRSLERERDDWQKRFQVHVSGHLTAQSMYERDLVRSRQVGATLLKKFNEYRVEKGDAPIELQRLSDILPVDGEPVGTFKRQLEEHIALLRSLDEAFKASAPE